MSKPGEDGARGAFGRTFAQAFKGPAGTPRLLLVMAAWTALWALQPHAFLASDPWVYSKYAHALTQDARAFFAHAPDDPFAHRLGVTVPAALAYASFGVHAWTTHLWPLIASLCLMAGVYAALPPAARATGLLLCAASAPLFRASMDLFPDVIAATFMFLSCLLLYDRAAPHRDPDRPATAIRPSARALLAVAFLFLAFMAKESAYWVLPLWVAALASDLRARRRAVLRSFHLPALGASVVLCAGYLWFSAETWGHPLARLLNVEAISATHLWSWSGSAPAAWPWLERLAARPVWMFLKDYGPVALMAIPLLAAPLIAPFLATPPRLPRLHRFWIAYTLCTGGLFWFGSTSFTHYQPLPAIPRMALPVLPGLLILSALLLSGHAGNAVWRPGPRVRIVFASLVVLHFAFAAAPWPRAPSPEASAVRIVKAAVADASDAPRSVLLLCGDARSPEALAFYFGYAYPERLVVMSAEDFLARGGNADEHGKTFLFLHGERTAFLRDAYGANAPDFDGAMAGEAPAFREGPVSLYEIRSPEDAIERLRNAVRSSAP